MAFITSLEDLKDFFGLTPNLIGDLPIDVVLSESPTYDFEITEHPVMSGASISDARIKKPIGVTLECIFTDPDFSAGALAKSFISGTFSLNTWKDKRDRLYEIKDTNELIDVNTVSNSYTDMTIVNVTPDIRPTTANAFFCTVEFREIETVSTDTRALDFDELSDDLKKKQTDDQAAASNTSSPTTDAGKKNTSSSNQSAASKLLGF